MPQPARQVAAPSCGGTARNDVALEAAVSRLSFEPTVSSVGWNVLEAGALLAAEE